MIFRHLNLNPPRFIGEKSFFFYPSFSVKSAKISVLLIHLNGTLYSSIYLKKNFNIFITLLCYIIPVNDFHNFVRKRQLKELLSSKILKVVIIQRQ